MDEIRRQFREIPGLLEGKEGARPDAARCVDISTAAALKEMILPGLTAVIAPVVVGLVLGAAALGGMLAGGDRDRRVAGPVYGQRGRRLGQR